MNDFWGRMLILTCNFSCNLGERRRSPQTGRQREWESGKLAQSRLSATIHKRRGSFAQRGQRLEMGVCRGRFRGTSVSPPHRHRSQTDGCLSQVEFRSDGFNHFVCAAYPAHSHWTLRGDQVHSGALSQALRGPAGRCPARQRRDCMRASSPCPPSATNPRTRRLPRQCSSLATRGLSRLRPARHHAIVSGPAHSHPRRQGRARPPPRPPADRKSVV